MKKSEMKTLLFEMLSGILHGTEFRLKKSDDAFWRKISGGTQRIGLPLWDYRPEFEFSLTICFRIDAVEDISNLFSGAAPKYHAKTVTTIIPLEFFTNSPTKFKVTTAAEVESAGRTLSNVLRDKVIPFLNDHKDIQSLERAVNCEHPGIDISNYPWRALTSVILAQLAGNRDIDRIINKHRNDMQLAQEADHPFNRLVDYLKTR